MSIRYLSLSSCPFHIKLHNTLLYAQIRVICKHRILLTVIMSAPLLTSACKVAKNFVVHAKTSNLQAPDTLSQLNTAQLNTIQPHSEHKPKHSNKQSILMFRLENQVCSTQEPVSLNPNIV